MKTWVAFAMGVGAVLLPILLGVFLYWIDSDDWADSEVDDG